MSAPQREATSDARALGRAVRDNYDALRAEGFTSKQSLYFLAVWAANVPPTEQAEGDAP